MPKQPPPDFIGDKKLLALILAITTEKKSCSDASFGEWQPKHKSRLQNLVCAKDLDHQIDGHDDTLCLTVEIEMSDSEDFKFRLTSDTPELYFPIFRYDSKGFPHRNRHLPLGKDMVPCPHFHRFDDDGRWIAYRTVVIDKEESALADPSNALHHFCIEGNIEVEVVPSIGNLQSSIPPDGGNPLNEVTF